MTTLPAVTTTRVAWGPAEELATDTETMDATDRLPVVALVGRPNVGKSTFIAA